MAINTMDELFVETLRDVYYAEKQILRALPNLAKKAHSRELKEVFEKHRRETEGQIGRLEKIFEMLEVAPRGRKCEAIEGIIREAKDHMQQIEDEGVLDAGIIGSAQAVEHYEISRYGTLIEWAKDLGLDQAAKLMTETLEEEKKSDALLTQLARSSVNPQAMA
jgi:ferritin-like metal-binding protein YciE